MTGLNRKQVEILHETVAVRYTERLPLTHRRKMGTMSLERSEKTEGLRIESEYPQNKPPICLRFRAGEDKIYLNKENAQ